MPELIPALSVAPDPWAGLRTHTPARIALGACGNSLPTAEVLDLGMAHAQARDAVHQSLDVTGLGAQLAAEGWDWLRLHSAAPDRASYLRRPDLGRQLSADSQALLASQATSGCDLLCVLGDGLSAKAVQLNALPLLRHLLPHWQRRGLRVGPVVLAEQARVALGDPIGAALGAKLVIMLIGERPGLSASDSLGAYLTWAPSVGMQDAQRNCVSNIRDAGLVPAAAAAKIAWLVERARQLQTTGITLKDESPAGLSLADGAVAALG